MMAVSSPQQPQDSQHLIPLLVPIVLAHLGKRSFPGYLSNPAHPSLLLGPPQPHVASQENQVVPELGSPDLQLLVACILDYAAPVEN